MMKRVASTILLLLFTTSIVGRTIERTEAWASQHALDSKHRGEHHTSFGMAKAHKDSARQGTKIGEDGWLLDISFISSLATPPSHDRIPHALTSFIADPNRQIVSSRAPPTQSL